jgi:PAS domain S-box-containing protein
MSDKETKRQKGRRSALYGAVAKPRKRAGKMRIETRDIRVSAIDEGQKFWKVIQSIPVGVHMYRLEADGDLVFVGANPAADRILGLDHTRFLGKTIEEAFPPLAGTEVPERYRRVAARGESWKTDQIFYEDDQIQGAFEVHAFQSAPGTVIATFTDITERKRMEVALQESEKRYRTIFEQAGDAIFILDGEGENPGRIVDANEAAARMHGYSRAELLKMNIADLDTPDSARKVQERVGRILEGEPFKTELYHIRKDGSIFPVEVSAGLQELGNHRYIVAFDRDISERKKADKALKRSEEQIRRFAYSVSHDLKNPAVALNGLTQLLRKRCGAALDERTQGICEQIIQSSERIAQLVETINVYISSRESPLRVESVKPKEILHIIREEFCSQLSLRHIRWVEPAEMPEIRADTLSLLRVFRNLVDNALKYAGDQLSEIRIGYESSDRFHVFSVTDDGVGVGEAESKKIFRLFKRPAASRAIAGTGLGLAIVKEIAEHHKGQVWTAAGEKRGITFFVSFSKEL